MTAKNLTARELSSAEINQVDGGFAFLPIFWAGMKFGGTVARFTVRGISNGHPSIGECVGDWFTGIPSDLSSRPGDFSSPILALY
jgi:hypothetical protein